MVEILGFIWLTCFILSGIITGLNIWSVVKMSKSSEFKVLNENLAKIEMFWSLSSENVQPLNEGNSEADVKKVIRTYILLGGLGFFSLIGFSILFVVSLSMRMLVGRAAKALLRSPLTTDTGLSVESIKTLVDTFTASR